MNVLAQMMWQGGPRTPRQALLLDKIQRQGLNQHYLLKCMKKITLWDCSSKMTHKQELKYYAAHRKLQRLWESLSHVSDLNMKYSTLEEIRQNKGRPPIRERPSTLPKVEDHCATDADQRLYSNNKEGMPASVYLLQHKPDASQP